MVSAIPEGREGLIPHLVCIPCSAAIAFYKQAFGAQEPMPPFTMPDGRIRHAALMIDGHPLFLVDELEGLGPADIHSEGIEQKPVMIIHRYVVDVDAAVQRAVDAGATVVSPPTDMFWGDRYAVVKDPFNHHWSLATHLRDATPEEVAAAAQQFA